MAKKTNSKAGNPRRRVKKPTPEARVAGSEEGTATYYENRARAEAAAKAASAAGATADAVDGAFADAFAGKGTRVGPDAKKASAAAASAAAWAGGPGGGLMQQIRGWHAGVKAKPGVGGFVARNPLLTGGVALAAAPMVARMLAKGVKGLGDSITGAGAMDDEDDARAERAGMLAQQMRVKRLQQDMRINAIRMMQSDPALAQELMAGRRLPKGATVIGGRQRQDLLMEAAARMGQMPGGDGGGY